MLPSKAIHSYIIEKQMGSEYLALSSEDQLIHAGHHATFTFVGDIENVRAWLVSAVEKLGYLVIEENPIIARHTKSRYSSSSILDFVHTLTIRLKLLAPDLTRAVFEYNYADVYGKTAKTVLIRQAKAIAAIARVESQTGLCWACSTVATDSSRFCRKCGASMDNVPAELEVLHIAAESHAGYLLVLQGTIGFMLSFLTLLLIIAIKGPAVVTAALVFTMIFAVPSLVLTLFGIRRLRRTFREPKEKNERTLAVAATERLSGETFNNTLPEMARVSVTEGTTELLNRTVPQPSPTDIDAKVIDKA